ncbi:MAG: cytochrome C [Limnospira sp.]
MFHPKSPHLRRSRWRSLLLRCFCILVAVCLAVGITSRSATQTSDTSIGTVDWVPPQYQLGQELYLENCATCHIPIPPQVLPRQTWQQILQDTDHYGVQIEPLIDPPRLLIWNYLRTFSRSMSVNEERIPYRIERSRFFRALHPQVEFSQPITLNSCQTCHPGASDYDFRSLGAQWERIDN